MKLERDAWWLVALALAGAMWVLALVAPAQTLGRVMPIFGVAILVLAGCFRLFEQLLHVRFPSSQVQTSSGRYASYGIGAVLAVQAIVVVAARVG